MPAARRGAIVTPTGRGQDPDEPSSSVGSSVRRVPRGVICDRPKGGGCVGCDATP
jgi:hypothetical protein